MAYRWMAGWCLLMMFLSACQSSSPQTVYVMEVTKVVTVVVTPDGTPPAAVTARATPATTTTPAITPSPVLSPTPDLFPTPVIGQIYVAEQAFQRGRMFWLQPVQQIWVATTDDEGNNTWSVYEDTFVDGQPETSATLTPPAGLIQPERGFGKLWRETAAVQAELGWALEPEFGYVTRYEYRAGGRVENNQYIPGKGKHLVTMLDGRIIEFNEEDRTWQILETGAGS
ncbi:MAG: hypothetical protein MUE40_05430 [Anaerolineae bacterium]|jgi:hypothetical protein|nr:hypothetical protein [Anaerolineae bacterium]